MPGILDGTVDPDRVFDRVFDREVDLDGYRAMDVRDALKIIVRP